MTNEKFDAKELAYGLAKMNLEVAMEDETWPFEEGVGSDYTEAEEKETTAALQEVVEDLRLLEEGKLKLVPVEE